MTNTSNKPRIPLDDTEWVTLIRYDRHTLICALWFTGAIAALSILTKLLGS